MKIFKPKTLCHEYWQKKSINWVLYPSKKSEVSQMRHLTLLNRKILTGEYPKNLDFKNVFGGFEENIRNADIEFKNLNKTSKELVVYRGIPKPDENSKEAYKKLFEKAKSLKENETLVMKEYAFAGFHENLAKAYMKDNGGIMYEITVPKGAQISKLSFEIAFPRYSRFECTGNKEIKDKDKNNYHFIKLKYKLPKDDWNNFTTRIAKIFNIKK